MSFTGRDQVFMKCPFSLVYSAMWTWIFFCDISKPIFRATLVVRQIYRFHYFEQNFIVVNWEITPSAK